MKKNYNTEFVCLAAKNASLSLKLLFFSLLELLYQSGRTLLKWLIIAIILIIKAGVFVFLSPYSLYKCAARAIRHRSFAAAGQTAKWIWLDYWKGFRL